MLFGIPWFAIIPIVAIVGGLLFAYKEQELKFEEKRLTSSREVNELRKIIHNLKSRIENLEAKVAAGNTDQKNSEADPLSSIEIDDEVEAQNNDNAGSKRKFKADN
ncbi:MAG: hypothetical protein WD059_07975 [Balneolaceae bacterium]